MSASLVGSEMCIRDSPFAALFMAVPTLARTANPEGEGGTSAPPGSWPSGPGSSPRRGSRVKARSAETPSEALTGVGLPCRDGAHGLL
eukprot:11221378-Alexandrium_andersonii.AAC.1